MKRWASIQLGTVHDKQLKVFPSTDYPQEQDEQVTGAFALYYWLLTIYFLLPLTFSTVYLFPGFSCLQV